MSSTIPPTREQLLICTDCCDTPATARLRKDRPLTTLQPTKRQPATAGCMVRVERGGRVTTASLLHAQTQTKFRKCKYKFSRTHIDGTHTHTHTHTNTHKHTHQHRNTCTPHPHSLDDNVLRRCALRLCTVSSKKNYYNRDNPGRARFGRAGYN